MKINGLSLLHEFIQQYPDTKKWIDNWIAETKVANWSTPQDIKDRYATCSFLAKNIVIFNVRGNNYRMEVVVAYNTKIVIVRRIETHADYTRRLR